MYVDLRKFREAWTYQCVLPNIPGEFDTCHVLEIGYTRWQSRDKLMIYGKVLLWDENHLFNHYKVYCYGTDKRLSHLMVPKDEVNAKAHPSPIPGKLREKVLRQIG